ncbi:MAG: 50S ribosomal protein L25 [Deltaproteobacteria bacterium]|nr:50S ribosomal protein L25 [Deltaproteobacteria bacterium]
MERVVLKATKREVLGKKVGALRRAGKLPAVLYGQHLGSIPIQLDAHDTWLKLSRLHHHSLVSVELDGNEYLALIREEQRDPIKPRLLHLDLQAVSLTEKLRTTVEVELTGTAPAVKEFDAILVEGLTELEVECLPQDLPERLVVDISSLKDVGDSIHVRDLQVPPGLEILEDPDEVIVSATAPAVVPVEEVAEAEEVPAAPEAAEKVEEESEE